tara:strand:+ start:4352 stop:5086 length:735 start_codon:yes stop_codon:yes gene_type:complete
MVQLHLNPLAKRTAIDTVVDNIWSDKFFDVMKANGCYDKKGFIAMLKDGMRVEVLMTTRQVESLDDARQTSTEYNLQPVFKHHHAEFITNSRTNYCKNCGAYHEHDTVMRVMTTYEAAASSPDFDEDDCFNDEDNPAYGLFCGSCFKPAQLLNLDPIVCRWEKRQYKMPMSFDDLADCVTEGEYDSFDDFPAIEGVAAFVNKLREHRVEYNPTTAYSTKQLELMGLDFLCPLKMEDYEELPLQG